MEKVTFFAVKTDNGLKPIAKRTKVLNGGTTFELLDPETLALPSNTELVAFEETNDSVKTVNALLYFLSAQTLNQNVPEVVLSSTFIPAVNLKEFLREDVASNDFE